MPTLVLSHRYSADSNALFSAALAAGWDVERLHSFRCPDGLAERQPIYYGETLLGDAIAEDLGIALLEPTADWLPLLSKQYRLRDIKLTTLADALTMKERVFVKPTDEKCFPARVYENGAAIDPDPLLARDLPVLVSEPVRFDIEFRFFIVERTVGTFSPYIRNGTIARSDSGDWSANEDEIESAKNCIRVLIEDTNVELPPAVVIDVGRMVDRGWGIVEANPAWASGLCGADPTHVLTVLRRASVSRNALTAADRKWMRMAAAAANS